MIREFVITEVMFDGLSGDVRGIVTVDDWTGGVESIECQEFDFYCDSTDSSTKLNGPQQGSAEQIVLRTLAADGELTDSSEPYLASAARHAAPLSATMSASQKVLADYLEHRRRTNDDADQQPPAGHKIPFRRLG